jgi:hypothetical protein
MGEWEEKRVWRAALCEGVEDVVVGEGRDMVVVMAGRRVLCRPVAARPSNEAHDRDVQRDMVCNLQVLCIHVYRLICRDKKKR